MFLVFCFVETGQAPIYTVRWDIEHKVWKTIIFFISTCSIIPLNYVILHNGGLSDTNPICTYYYFVSPH